MEKEVVGGDDVENTSAEIGEIALGMGDEGCFLQAKTVHGPGGSGEFALFVVGGERPGDLDGGEGAVAAFDEEVAFGVASGVHEVGEGGFRGEELEIDQIFEFMAAVGVPDGGNGGDETGVAGVDFFGVGETGFGRGSETGEAAEQIGFFKVGEVFEDGGGGADVHGVLEAARGYAGTNVGEEVSGQGADGGGVAETVTDDDVAEDDIGEKFGEDFPAAGFDMGGEPADGEIVGEGFRRGRLAGEAKKFGIGEGPKFGIEVAAREFGAEFAAQELGVGSRDEDAAARVEATRYKLFPGRDVLDFVQHNRGGVHFAHNGVQNSKVGGLEGGKPEVVEVDGGNAFLVGFGPLMEERGLSRAADAGDDGREAFFANDVGQGIAWHTQVEGAFLSLGEDGFPDFTGFHGIQASCAFIVDHFIKNAMSIFPAMTCFFQPCPLRGKEREQRGEERELEWGG